jgi:hypothetical protein
MIRVPLFFLSIASLFLESNTVFVSIMFFSWNSLYEGIQDELLYMLDRNS